MGEEAKKGGKAGVGCLYIFIGLMGLAFIGSLLPEDKEKAAQKMRETVENKRKGFHCLSSWDGSHSGFTAIVKGRLRDPKSFEHIETKVTPVNEKGFHSISMKYRAINGFGGMNVETGFGTYRNSDCLSEFIGSV